jgi:hypothetical protein
MMNTYMAAFHVFVEGATDASASGLKNLADAIAVHYGLPAADLLARLQKGRFRVKGNIDHETAETYARDLRRLGARCVIEEATADNSQRTTPIPFPAVKPPADVAPPARPATPSAPPSALPPRTGAPSAPPSALPPRTGAPSAPPANSAQFQSGLSAAFSGQMPAADLGALGREDVSFSLSTVDGADDQSPAASPADGGGFAASIGPAPEAPPPRSGKVAKVAKPTDEPLDMFAPPEMQGDEFKVDIAADERDVSRTSTPPPMGDGAAARPSSQKIPTTPASGRISKPSLQAPNVPVDVVAPSTNKFGALGEPRNRFIAGVFLAVILGFVPAHFIAKMREDSAFETVDRKVIAAQQAADTLDVWQGLDRLRTDQLARKEAEKRNAALIGFAVWALAGGAIAWAFFKKVPWDA